MKIERIIFGICLVLLLAHPGLCQKINGGGTSPEETWKGGNDSFTALSNRIQETITGLKETRSASHPEAKTAADPGKSSAKEANDKSITILTYNILRTNNQQEMSVKMAGDLASVYGIAPDFILFQEVMGRKDEKSPEKIFADRMGNYHSRFVSKSGKTSGEGSSIISRYPFVYSDFKVFKSRAIVDSKRVILMGEFDVPGIGCVRVANVHLAWAPFNFIHRIEQIKEALSWLQERNNTKPADVTILGGDFNAAPGAKEISLVTVENNAGSLIFLDFNDPSMKTTKHGRIDYVFVAASGNRLVDFMCERFLWKENPISDHISVLHKYRLSE